MEGKVIENGGVYSKPAQRCDCLQRGGALPKFMAVNPSYPTVLVFCSPEHRAYYSKTRGVEYRLTWISE